MQHLGASCLIGELLAGVGAVCPRHLDDIEEVKAVTSGGSGGGGGAGAELLSSRSSLCTGFNSASWTRSFGVWTSL